VIVCPHSDTTQQRVHAKSGTYQGANGANLPAETDLIGRRSRHRLSGDNPRSSERHTDFETRNKGVGNLGAAVGSDHVLDVRRHEEPRRCLGGVGDLENGL